jgi:hypothetical protein
MLTSARARAMRCCWPPESWLGLRSANSGSRTTSSISLTRVATSASLTIFLLRRPYATLSNTFMCGNSA